ncbi:MAG: hypothetical protein ABSH29_20940 [Acidimicrobiales bacterium]|jgi:hypothetical protein
MGQWKRTLRNTGISLAVVGVGVVGAAGVASAHGDGSQFVRGTVSALGTGSFTITTHNGTTEMIDTTMNTTYAETGTLVAPTGVVQGQDVAVRLDPADATPTAVEVTVILDRVSGKVTGFTSTSITLSGPRGTTRDVEVSSPGTTYYDGKTTATGVTVGEFVIAFGTWDTTTPSQLDALFVDIGSTTVCPPRSPRITPSGTVPPKGTDPSTATWGTHIPAAAPAAVSSADPAPKVGTPLFSRSSDPQTTGAAGPSGGGQFGHGFSGGPAAGSFGAGGPGAGGHGFSGGAGGPGSRGGRG